MRERPAGDVTEPIRGGRYAVVAFPLIRDKEVARRRGVLRHLDEVDANVALIRRQILLSGGIALVIALAAGYLVARALSQRVGRLEQAARQVASGDFSNPIRADSDDELGQLAAAFDDMQHQLAQLDRARKQFIATASHELRTPIFSLGGFLELLADEDLDEETRRQFLDQVRGQVDRHAQAHHRAARPLAAGVRRARAPAGADRPRAARARGRRRVHPGGRSATSPRWCSISTRSRSRSTATPNGWRRCFVS